MSIKLAFYKAEGEIGDRLIRWWTKSQYSHCEIVIDGCSYSSSSRDGGVRAKVIDWNPEHWDFLEVGADIFNYNATTPEKVVAWFHAHLGEGYDWGGLLWFVVPLPWGSRQRWFCSEACGEALGFERAWRLNPQDLYDRLQALNPQRVTALPVGLGLASAKSV